jgi:ribosome maturation factor RimP
MEQKDQLLYKQNMKTIETLAANTMEQIGYELVDVEWKSMEGKPHIVVYIDSTSGISLEDCQKVSKFLGEVLDREDPLSSKYYLEISSPGIERRLKKAEDFIRFLGKDIKLKTLHKINGSRNYRGVLKEFKDNKITILMENGEEIKIDLLDIARANLWYKQEPRR